MDRCSSSSSKIILRVTLTFAWEEINRRTKNQRMKQNAGNKVAYVFQVIAVISLFAVSRPSIIASATGNSNTQAVKQARPLLSASLAGLRLGHLPVRETQQPSIISLKFAYLFPQLFK